MHRPTLCAKSNSPDGSTGVGICLLQKRFFREMANKYLLIAYLWVTCLSKIVEIACFRRNYSEKVSTFLGHNVLSKPQSNHYHHHHHRHF